MDVCERAQVINAWFGPTPAPRVPSPLILGVSADGDVAPTFLVALAGRSFHSDAELSGGGDHVTFRREPRNSYDENAIAILNGKGKTVGYVPRGASERLAPLIDTGKIRLEGGAVDPPDVVLTNARSGARIMIAASYRWLPDAAAEPAPLLILNSLKLY